MAKALHSRPVNRRKTAVVENVRAILASKGGDLWTIEPDATVYDALAMTFRTVKVRRNPRCPICGENPEITELRDELDALNVCNREKR